MNIAEVYCVYSHNRVPRVIKTSAGPRHSHFMFRSSQLVQCYYWSILSDQRLSGHLQLFAATCGPDAARQSYRGSPGCPARPPPAPPPPPRPCTPPTPPRTAATRWCPGPWRPWGRRWGPRPRASPCLAAPALRRVSRIKTRPRQRWLAFCVKTKTFIDWAGRNSIQSLAGKTNTKKSMGINPYYLYYVIGLCCVVE